MNIQRIKRGLGFCLFAGGLSLLHSTDAHAGLNACDNQVRFEREGCETGGLYGPQVWDAFSFSQIDRCRDACDQCCDDLQNTTLHVVLEQIQNLCHCMGEFEDPRSCMRAENYDDYDDFLRVLGASGALGDFSPDLPFDDPAAKIGVVGDKGLNFLWHFILRRAITEVCEDGLEWSLENIPRGCKRQCRRAFPRRTEHPPQPPAGGGGSAPTGGGGGGTSDTELPPLEPPPPPPCEENEGDTCMDSRGNLGTLTAYCNCQLDIIEVYECFYCDEQDPPRWCDEFCWQYGL